MKTMEWFYKLCRWTLGGVFIHAGGTKLLAPQIFAVLIDAYGIVPAGLLLPVAIGLPLLEVIAGIGTTVRYPRQFDSHSRSAGAFHWGAWLRHLDGAGCGLRLFRS
jgi:hypothetical protein